MEIRTGPSLPHIAIIKAGMPQWDILSLIIYNKYASDQSNTP